MRSSHESESDCENQASPGKATKAEDSDSPKRAPSKYRPKSALLWREVATSQTLEESIVRMDLPDRKPQTWRNFRGRDSQRPENRYARKRRSDPAAAGDGSSCSSSSSSTSYFAKRMKRVDENFGLAPLPEMLRRCPTDVAMFRSRWVDALRRNRRMSHHVIGEKVNLPALTTSEGDAASKTHPSSSVSDDSAASGMELLAKEISWNIGEEKVDVVYRLLETFGVEKTVELYNAVRDVEAAGGMETADGKRRRTSGGAFMQLLKDGVSGDDALKEKLKSVLKEDGKVTKKMLLVDKKAHIHAKARETASSMRVARSGSALGRQMAMTPGESLEDLPTRVDLLVGRKRGEEKRENEEEEEKLAVRNETEDGVVENTDKEETGVDHNEEEGGGLDLGINIANEMEL